MTNKLLTILALLGMAFYTGLVIWGMFVVGKIGYFLGIGGLLIVLILGVVLYDRKGLSD